MKVSGFSYVRNGIHFDYPFLEAIQSVLPLCDEFFAVVGDSTDGTREAILSLNNPTIKIIDTLWDENSRTGGYIFSQQANIGLDHCTGDWCFHIQADEVVHEKDISLIKEAMAAYHHQQEVEGLLFRFINFFGDYTHIAPSRRYHNKEIRIVRNSKHIRSYLDSQGFRHFNNPENYLAEKGRKLNVKQIEAAVYHYSFVKHPRIQTNKRIEFGKRWHSDEEVYRQNKAIIKEFDYTSQIDVLEKFTGTHPSVMDNRVTNINWQFLYDASKSNMTFIEKLLYLVERITGKRLFSYNNYKKI
ncbi:MAG: glycosyltransferase [Chitinophagaceae bacterium]